MGVRLSAAAASVIVCVLTSQSWAGPKDYCDSFARDAASQKTGLAETAGGTIGGSNSGGDGNASDAAGADEKWHSAYQTSFADCMGHYGVPQTAELQSPAPAKQIVKAKR